MSHMRQQIREKIAAVLSAIDDVYIFGSYHHAFADGDLPAIVITFSSEEVKGSSAGSLDHSLPRNTNRVATYAIDVLERSAVDLDDTLDEVSVRIEQLLAGNRSLDGLVDDLRIASANMDYDLDGQAPSGILRMIWEADYWCLEDNPEEAM
ncbi:MAG: hypothetical protein ACYCZR_01745 [Burkholderiales bacterium]